jgi:NAD(P)-dependent dehydrogenase (short-subunit alcohol dehydrogenase family)
MNLEGKVALITGGGTGIGAAIAKRFVGDGAKICITGRRQEMLDQAAQSLHSRKVTTCSGDVSKNEDVERMVETTLTFGGRLGATVVDVSGAAISNIPLTHPLSPEGRGRGEGGV